MDRALQHNILAKSGKAVEVAGDIDIVLLDKTGTITMGNRHATKVYSHQCLIPPKTLGGFPRRWRRQRTRRSEGKSIVKLFEEQDHVSVKRPHGPTPLPLGFSVSIAFTAQTRMSGELICLDGRHIRKASGCRGHC